jgi:hypothetical protein
VSAEIEFEEEGHRYFFRNGERRREVPAVSRILRDAGLVDVRYYTEYHRHFGKMVHRVCTLDDQGILDETTVDPAIKGRLGAWRAFKRDLGVQIADIEYFVGDEVLGYCGRVDRMLRIRNRLVVTDLKSGVSAPWHKKQVALYVRAHPGWEKMDGLLVYLKDSGRYALEPRKGMELLTDIREGENLVARYYREEINLWA